MASPVSTGNVWSVLDDLELRYSPVDHFLVLFFCVSALVWGLISHGIYKGNHFLSVIGEEPDYRGFLPCLP